MTQAQFNRRMDIGLTLVCLLIAAFIAWWVPLYLVAAFCLWREIDRLTDPNRDRERR